MSQPQPSCSVRSRLLLPHPEGVLRGSTEEGHTPKVLDHLSVIPSPLTSSPLNQEPEAQNPKEAERFETKGFPINIH